MRPLSPLDASFLHLETAEAHMHVGSICTFEGPAPSHAELLEHFDARLDLVPRYRQRVRHLSVSQPVWTDDRHFRLAYHLRRSALPAPGGEAELTEFVSAFMCQHLDRARPLWEAQVVEGLEGDRWALVTKVHHAVIDGVSGSEIIGVLLDAEPDPAPNRPSTWVPAPSPPATAVLRQSLGWVGSPVRMVGRAPRALRGSRSALLHAGSAVSSLAPLSRLLLGAGEDSSLTGEVGPHRRWSRVRVELTDVKRIRAALGGTINDVVLAAVTAGFRAILAARGEDVAERSIRTLVPVSVRTSAQQGEHGNRVSGVWPELPVSVEDPVERLAAIREQMDDVKASRAAVAGEVLTGLSGFAPPLLLSLAWKLAMRRPQRSVATVTSNVPGPQRRLYLMGRTMLEAAAYIPLGLGTRLNTVIFSYDGALQFAATGDYETVPDLQVFCDGIAAGIAELVAAADQQLAAA